MAPAPLPIFAERDNAQLIVRLKHFQHRVDRIHRCDARHVETDRRPAQLKAAARLLFPACGSVDDEREIPGLDAVEDSLIRNKLRFEAVPAEILMRARSSSQLKAAIPQLLRNAERLFLIAVRYADEYLSLFIRDAASGGKERLFKRRSGPFPLPRL